MILRLVGNYGEKLIINNRFKHSSDTVVMNVTTPYNNAFPTIMYTGGEYWLLTEAETSQNSGLWRVNAWYSTNPTSGYTLASNSPILTNDEACPQIFLIQ